MNQPTIYRHGMPLKPGVPVENATDVDFEELPEERVEVAPPGDEELIRRLPDGAPNLSPWQLLVHGALSDLASLGPGERLDRIRSACLALRRFSTPSQESVIQHLRVVAGEHWPPHLDDMARDWLDGKPDRRSDEHAEQASGAAGTTTAPESADDEFEILDSAPDSISRPLCIVSDTAYALVRVYGKRSARALLVIREDGAVFSEENVRGAYPLRELGISIRPNDVIEDSRAWSGAGIKRYSEGLRPAPAEVFNRVVEVVDLFMDFDRSLADQRTMCEFIACYVLATYLLDAFCVIGYLWSNGDKGSGKSHLLELVSELAFLGMMILNSSTVATLRDMADQGATLAFDDAEGIADPKKTDPDKRALFLAGNRKSSTVSLKEQVGKRWVTRHVRTFCPRLFSAIRLPDDVLASRTISIPLVRSIDKPKTDRNPVDWSTWPCDRRELIDDLWATGLAHLTTVRRYDAAAAARSKLSGRNLEPWRAILAVALWLEEEHGVAGIFARIQGLSEDYQKERSTLEKYDLTRLLIAALREMVGDHGSGKWKFATKDLTRRINALARENELVSEEEEGSADEAFTSGVRVGKLLDRLRFERPKARSSAGREWVTSRGHVEKLCLSYGMTLPGAADAQTSDEPVTPDTPVTPVTEPRPSVTGVTGMTGVTGPGEGAEDPREEGVL